MAELEPIPGRDGSLATLHPHVHLMAAIILQALIDSQSKDVVDKTDAVLWLASEECQEMGELLGVDVWRGYVTGRCRIPTAVKRRGASAKGWRVE